MSGQWEQEQEPFHFGLWVEMTILMDFLSGEERAALLTALGTTASEFGSVSANYREMLQANIEPGKTALFQMARREAASAGREQAIERFNRFLDGLNEP